jgi:RNA recognition motif-containing protein
VPIDPSSNRCKGFARISFRTAEEAKRIVTRYNNTTFMNAKIKVKFDSVPVAASYALNPTSVPVTVVATQVPHTYGSGQGVEEAVQPKSAPCQPLVVNGSGTGRKEVAT